MSKKWALQDWRGKEEGKGHILARRHVVSRYTEMEGLDEERWEGMEGLKEGWRWIGGKG